MSGKMKYNPLIVMKVIQKSDILVIAMSDSKNFKKIKALSNSRFSINCFYHTDNKPSMILDRKNNSFYCYSCKQTGNAISLFMTIHNLKFLASLETMAAAFDVKLPNRSYQEIDQNLVDELKSIKESESYKTLIKQSYIKTLKK